MMDKAIIRLEEPWYTMFIKTLKYDWARSTVKGDITFERFTL